MNIKNCPDCGGVGYQNDYLISTGHVACSECLIELPTDVWERLSKQADVVISALAWDHAITNFIDDIQAAEDKLRLCLRELTTES